MILVTKISCELYNCENEMRNKECEGEKLHIPYTINQFPDYGNSHMLIKLKES